MELFSLRKIRRICPQHRGLGPPAPAHGSTDFIKHWPLATGSTARIKPIKSVSLLGCLDSIWRWVAIVSSQLLQESPDVDPTAEVAGSSRGRRWLMLTTARRGWARRLVGVWVFLSYGGRFFWWGLLLRDHNDEGNSIRLTLISEGRQRSPATLRRLGRCMEIVWAASNEASAPRMCAEASSSSLLASRLINCFERWQKTQIWWLPRVQRVLDLWPKIRTMGGAIYRGF
jgi:hypothetical protein